MRFLDSSIILHAFLKPRRRIPPPVQRLKDRCKRILRRVEEGEPVVTTIVHLAEIANILEAHAGLQQTLCFLSSMFAADNIRIEGVDSRTAALAVSVAQRYGVSYSDAVAYLIMAQRGIKEVYSTDKHFDNLPGVRRILE